jgi:hypothetical protein
MYAYYLVGFVGHLALTAQSQAMKASIVKIPETNHLSIVSQDIAKNIIGLETARI